MRRRSWCLRMDCSSWRVTELDGEERILQVDSGQMSPSPETVWSAFQELGYDGGDVLLALPSAICLTGQIPASQIPPRCDDRTKLFLLEDLLPVAAEEVTADFLCGDARTLGVAVLTEPLHQTVEQLENLGLNIQSIVPWSFLAAHVWANQHPSGDLLVARTPSGFELIEVAGGRPCGWGLIDTENELRWRLAALSLELGRSLVIVSELAPPAGDSDQWIAPNCSWDEAALLSTRGALGGSLSPSVDLRRDRLAGVAVPRALRGYRRTFQLTTAFLLMTMLGGVLWQGARYQRMADDFASRQQQVFQQALPGQPVPPGIRSRLESELSRLKSQQDSAARVPGRESALLTLVRFLEGVPTSIRLRVNGLSVTGHKLNVRSEVRTPGDGSAFVQALRDSGFQARSPRSVRSGEGYNVDFEAQLPTQSLERKGEP